MRTTIYSLERDDLSVFSDRIPAFVIERTGTPGYFTIGAGHGILEKNRLQAICQFYIDSFQNGTCYGRLDYIYVSGEVRRKGIGRRLIDRMDTILKNSGISTLTLLFPKEGNKMPGFEIEREEAASFFEKCGFFLTADEETVFFSGIATLSKGLSKEDSGVSELSGLSDEEFSKLLSDIKKEAPLPADLSRSMDDYDLNMSFFYKEKDRSGVLLLTRFGYTMARINLLRAIGKGEKEGMLDLIQRAVLEWRDRMDDDFLIVIDGSAISDEKTFKVLLPGMVKTVLSKYVRFTAE